MNFWTVQTKKVMHWQGEKIDHCTEERSFSVQAETYAEAVDEVLKFGGGSVIARADVISVCVS